LQILLQDKYNIGALTVNIEFMWLGTKQMERLAKASLSPLSKSRHINSIFTIIHQYCIFIAVNAPILYLSCNKICIEMLFNLIIIKKDNRNPIDTSIIVSVRDVV
jgi:uncharacterized membrane-anchored protein YitT (DUF2179 family)